jgi:hypothetical protein
MEGGLPGTLASCGARRGVASPGFRGSLGELGPLISHDLIPSLYAGMIRPSRKPRAFLGFAA